MNPYQYQQAQITQQQLQYQYPPGYVQPQVFQYNYGHGQAASEPQAATGGQTVFAYGQQFAGNMAHYQAQAVPQQGAQVAYMQQGTVAQAQVNPQLYQQNQLVQAYAVQPTQPPANTFGHPLAQSQDQTALQQKVLLAAQVQQQQQQQQQQQATQPPLPEETLKPVAPPLPVEPAAPPPTSGTSAGSTGKLQQLIAQQKQYQEQLQQWQQQYAQWQTQHQNHPDQKQFLEWQQKMQQWRAQQEQLLEKQQKLVDDQIAAETQAQNEQNLQAQQQQLLQQQLQHQQVQQQQQQLLEQQKLQQQQQQQLLEQQKLQQQQQQQQLLQQQQQQQQFHSQQQQTHQQQIQNQPQIPNQPHLQRPAAPNQMSSQLQASVESDRLQRWQQYKSLQPQHQRSIQEKEDEMSSSQAGQYQQTSWFHSQQHKQDSGPVDEEGEGDELPSWLLQEPEVPEGYEQNQYGQTCQNETGHNQMWRQKQDASQRCQDQTRQKTNQDTMCGPPGQVFHGQDRYQQNQHRNWQVEGRQQEGSNQGHDVQRQQEKPKWLQQSTVVAQQGHNQREGQRIDQQESLSQLQRPRWLQGQKSQASQLSSEPSTEQHSQQIPKWLQGQKKQSPQLSNQQPGEQHLQQVPKWLQGQKSQASQLPDQRSSEQQSQQIPKWLQNKKSESQQPPQQPPKWLQGKAEPNQKAESKPQETRQQTQPLPKWMQGGSGLSKESGSQQTEVQQLPKWLQTKTSQSQMNKADSGPSVSQQEQPQSSSLQKPKWLQGKSTLQQQNSSKTEGDEMQQNQAKKELPKWMQQAGKVVETKSAQPLPKWLQGKLSGNQGSKGLANQQKNEPTVSSATVSGSTSSTLVMDSEQQRRYQEHLEYLKKSSSAPSQAGKPPMQNSPAKMKIQEELELLRKQQEQLQQLHEIERQMKQGSKSTPGAMPVSTSSSTQSAMTNTASYNEPDRQGERIKNNIPNYRKAPCKFFPGCRNGKNCRFWHPPCQYLERCRKPDCPYDHDPPPPPLAHLPPSPDRSSRIPSSSRYPSDIMGSYDAQPLQDQDEPMSYDIRSTFDAKYQQDDRLLQDPIVGEENVRDEQEPVRGEVRQQILRLSSHDEKIPGIGDNEYPEPKEKKEEDVVPSATVIETDKEMAPDVSRPKPGSEEESMPGEEKLRPQEEYFGGKPDSRDDYPRGPFEGGNQVDTHYPDDRLRQEQGRDRYSPPPGRSEWDRSNQRESGWPYPRDSRDRSPLHYDERDSRPPFPRDVNRLPLPREYRDRSPPLRRDDRAYPPDDRPGRDDWDRPPFGREWERLPPRDRPPRPDAWDRRSPPRRDRLPPPRDEWNRPPSPRDYRERSPPFDRRRGWSPPPRGFRDRDISPRLPPHIPPDEFNRFDRPPLPPHDEFDRHWRREGWPRDGPDRERNLYHDRDERPPPRDWDRRDAEYERERGRDPYDRDLRLRDPHFGDELRRSHSPPRWGHDHDENRYRGEHTRGGLGPRRERERDYPPLERRDYDRDMALDRRREHYPEPRGPPGDYRDERGPPSDPYYECQAPPPHPRDSRPPERPPPVEKVIEVVPVESILDVPGRDSRPDNIVIILRGPPGSGKTHVAKLIKDKEILNGGHAPRILAIDDYFLTEVEKYEKDPETGRKVKRKVTEYVYEEEMEEIYRASLFKSFMRTLDDGFFPVIIVDAIHDKVRYFEKYWSQAKEKGFQVYIAEVMADAHACAKRNSHNRTFEEINKMVTEWEEAPAHMLRLDTRSLLQDAVITEVEMEMADEPGTSEMSTDQAAEEKVEEQVAGLPTKSRWEMDETTEDRLNKLDGIRPLRKRAREESPPIIPDDYEDDPYDEREEDMRIGKKRVRWADLEEKKHLEHRRKIGFCIGTDWSLFTDPNAEIPH